MKSSRKSAYKFNLIIKLYNSEFYFDEQLFFESCKLKLNKLNSYETDKNYSKSIRENFVTYVQLMFFFFNKKT